MDVTAEQIRTAAAGATTLTQVARALDIRETKLSGKTGKAMRAVLPELDEILRTNRTAAKKGSTESSAPDSENVSPNDEPEEDNPYRPNSMYNTLFREGSRQYWDKTELIAHVAKLTGKEERLVAFQVPVLGNPNQQSNTHRSTVLKDEQGRIRFIRCRARR